MVALGCLFFGRAGDGNVAAFHATCSVARSVVLRNVPGDARFTELLLCTQA